LGERIRFISAGTTKTVGRTKEYHRRANPLKHKSRGGRGVKDDNSISGTIASDRDGGWKRMFKGSLSSEERLFIAVILIKRLAQTADKGIAVRKKTRNKSP